MIDGWRMECVATACLLFGVLACKRVGVGEHGSHGCLEIPVQDDTEAFVEGFVGTSDVAELRLHNDRNTPSHHPRRATL